MFDIITNGIITNYILIASIDSEWKCFDYLNCSQMDLPYPSQKEVTEDKNVLNGMKRIKSTIWSMKDLGKEEEPLTLKSRSILVKLIEKDNVKEISERLKKYQIAFTSELGTKQTRWLILHFCARWNAKNTMEYIIKTIYHEDQESLYGLINAKTCQGYTPLMVSVIYGSHDFLKSMLEFGGVDIFLVDLNRVTAYQMALSSQNQYAISKLMDYEIMNKTSTYLNIQKLQEPFQYPSSEVVCCCTSLWHAIKDWLFRSPKNKDIIDGLSEPMCTSRRTSEAVSEGFYRDREFLPDLQSICRPISQLDEYEIEWVRIQDLYDSDKGIRLFETYNPFDIIQTTFVLKHNLIILQLLARNPMLVRRMIYKDEDIPSCYKVFLFPKGVFQRVTIDDYIPCLKDKMEPMFITDSKECWPLLLQKAWVKTYGNYVAARNIHPRIILHQLTGFFTETYCLSQQPKEDLFSKLKKYSSTGYLTVLTSKQEPIRQSQEALGFQSFTILNFYEKDGKKMYLINCPFIISKWKQQSKNQPFGLKLLKSHYNTMNQMSIWMDTPTLISHFQSFTVCHVMDNSQRTEFQIKGTNSIFLKFFIASELKQKEKYYLKLYQYKEGDKEYYQEVEVGDVSISRDDRIDKGLVKRYEHSERIKMIEIFSGQYFCKIDVPSTGELKSYNLIIYGKQKLSIEGIDEEMGKIEWLYLLRDQIAKEPLEPVDETYMKREVQFFNYVLVIIKDLNAIRRSHKVTYEGSPIDYVVQGYQQLHSTIRLETYNDEFLFTMLKLKPDYKLSDLRLAYSSN